MKMEQEQLPYLSTQTLTRDQLRLLPTGELVTATLTESSSSKEPRVARTLTIHTRADDFRLMWLDYVEWQWNLDIDSGSMRKWFTGSDPTVARPTQGDGLASALDGLRTAAGL